jgi:hypothetical protein
MFPDFGGTKMRNAAFELPAGRSFTAIVAGGCAAAAPFTGDVYGQEKFCTKNQARHCASGQVKCR